MKVVLGKYMDGGAWPDALHNHLTEKNNQTGPTPAVTAGEPIVGPAGFISLLEERMGLPQRTMHGSRRIMIWQTLLSSRIQKAQNEGRLPFYAASFEKDAWNTARRILGMRDELKAAGAFEGSEKELLQRAEACAESLPRLAEMYELELSHAAAPAPGASDRLRLVLRELALWGISGLRLVELATPEALWEEPWRALFSLLREQGVTVRPLPFCGQYSGSALSVESVARLPVFSGRGKHIRLEAAGPSEAAEALAAALRARLSDGTLGRTVFVRREDSFELDAALERFSLPGTACRARSIARPFLELLPLYLRLQLLPFSPETLRQFLLLPVNPVSPSLRRRLLRALRKEEFSPYSSGFADWPASWRSAFGSDGEPEKKLVAEIRWFCPPERVPVSVSTANAATAGNIPQIRPESIVEAATALEEWAMEKPVRERRKTAELCRRLTEAVQEKKMPLSASELEKLLDSVLGEGEHVMEKRPPLPWSVLSDPGQLWGPADTVIWWDFTDDGNAVRDSSTWSAEEELWLKRHGFALSSAQQERRARTLAGLHPFLFGRRVITVIPRFHGSEESVPHPLDALLPEGLCTRKDAFSLLTKNEEIRQTDSADSDDFFRGIRRESLSSPARRQSWTEDTGTALSLPSSVPASGLQAALECPAAWYFKNVLHLEHTDAELAEEPVICGNLAHEVMAALLVEKRDADALGHQSGPVTSERIFAMLSALAREKAARLALPEHENTLRDMAERLTRSFQRLCARAEAEGLVFLDCEQSVEGDIGGMTCHGRYDLLFGSRESRVPCVVVDMKWSRRKTYREQTKGGCPVQLAAYHHLLETGRRLPSDKNDGAPLSPVHLRDAWFLLLPEAVILAASDGAKTLEEHWNDVEKRWQDIRGNLASGHLSLAEHAPGAEVCRWCDYTNLCGMNLSDTDDAEEEE